MSSTSVPPSGMMSSADCWLACCTSSCTGGCSIRPAVAAYDGGCCTGGAVDAQRASVGVVPCAVEVEDERDHSPRAPAAERAAVKPGPALQLPPGVITSWYVEMALVVATHSCGEPEGTG
eukprot:scaffold21787_cov62-Phaeocystis_antarctica.AAC.3